jgi:hypothetical protein
MLSPLYGQLSPLRVPTTDIAMLAANAYIAAVEAADGQSLESGVKSAFTDFIVGCHNDGIWSALKASCILAGARTLNGALVPLVGTAPTNLNFVSGDYNRKTGLLGNGSTKYLNSNRNNNSDPQNSFHLAVFQTQKNSGGTVTRIYLGAGTGVSGGSSIGRRPTTGLGTLRVRTTNLVDTPISVDVDNICFGTNRASSGSYSYRINGSSASVSASSQTPFNGNHFVFSINGGTTGNHSIARISYYSIGESIDLAKLDTRVSTLMTDLAAAI